MNYCAAYRLLDHDDDDDYECPPVVIVKGEALPTSIALVVLALAASELVILVLCKAMAWYADLVFYSRNDEWLSSSQDSNLQQHRTPETVAQSLHKFNYRPSRTGSASGEEEAESPSCPICLVEFEPNDVVCHGKTISCRRHVFHEQCLSRWLLLNHSTTCPCCRQDMMIVRSQEQDHPDQQKDEWSTRT